MLNNTSSGISEEDIRTLNYHNILEILESKYI